MRASQGRLGQAARVQPEVCEKVEVGELTQPGSEGTRTSFIAVVAATRRCRCSVDFLHGHEAFAISRWTLPLPLACGIVTAGHVVLRRCLRSCNDVRICYCYSVVLLARCCFVSQQVSQTGGSTGDATIGLKIWRWWQNLSCLRLPHQPRTHDSPITPRASDTTSHIISISAMQNRVAQRSVSVSRTSLLRL